MTRITWDGTGDRTYETGVDHGVLYIPNNSGVYTNGVSWNGLTTVTESPSGAEATALYADNIKYLNLISVEQFGATIEAYTAPDEFAQFDGLSEPSPGVYVGQQSRTHFGLCYRTILGNDVQGNDHGYKLHLIYNAVAKPSEKAFASVNDSPDAITFSWELSTTPIAAAPGMKPTAQLTIDSTKVDPTALATLEDALYGTAGSSPRLPTPAEVIAMFAGTAVVATPTAPTYNNGTHTLTIPAVTGVDYYANGDLITSGAHVITEDTGVQAEPQAGYTFPPEADTYWLFDFS